MLDEQYFKEQRDLRETVQDILRRTLVPLSERDAPATRGTSREQLLKNLGSTGLLGVGIDERFGGSGGGIADRAVIARELGRVLAPASIVTAAVGGELLQSADDQYCQSILREVAAGRSAALAWPQPSWAPWGRAEPPPAGQQTGEVTISARLTGVVDAGDASWLLILSAGPGAEEFPKLLVADMRHPSVRVENVNEIGVVRSFSTVSLDAVPARVSQPASESGRLAGAEGELLLAYEMLGASEAVIRLASDHAAAREQFGRPIGTFQAVSHRLAAAYIELQAAAAAASYALRGHGAPTFALSASMARETGVRCLTGACESAMQVLGAIGFTWEHPLHHYLKYAKTCDRLLVPERGIEAEITAFMEGAS